MSCRRVFAITVAALFLTAFVTDDTLAQGLGLHSYGLRGGINVNPDQFSFGAHVDIGRIGERVRLQPSGELGFGNGVILGSTNVDAHYLLASHNFGAYVGGGMGLNFIDVRSGIGSTKGLGIEPVVNAVGGVEWGNRPNERAPERHRYLLEARLGFGDAPELKLLFGVNF